MSCATRRSTHSSAPPGPRPARSLLLAELRQLGGALGREREGAGALSKLDAEFVMFALGIPMSPELGEAIPADLDRLPTRCSRGRARAATSNFAERPCDVDAILPADVCERLAEVKRRWDPDATIRSNHAIAVGSA